MQIIKYDTPALCRTGVKMWYDCTVMAETSLSDVFIAYRHQGLYRVAKLCFSSIVTKQKRGKVAYCVFLANMSGVFGAIICS